MASTVLLFWNILVLTKQFFDLVFLSKSLHILLQLQVFCDDAPLMQQQQDLFVWENAVIHSEPAHFFEGLNNYSTILQHRIECTEKLSQFG